MLACLCACETRFGAYLVVKGDTDFDQVELYFGKPIDSSGPGSGNAFATPMRGQQSGTIFDRTFDATDLGTIESANHTTFYLPPDEKNQLLGSYVVAVAIAGDSPVGIAELFDFTVPTDVVHEYHLDLTAWNPTTMERWGQQPGCVAWKKPRDGHDPVVAVVHSDDRDCDALASNVDCSDLCSQQSPACATGLTFCNSSPTFCALGCSVNNMCAATMCLPDAACTTPECVGLTNLDERLACGRDKTPLHLELLVDRSAVANNALCEVAFSFSPGVPCNQPLFVNLSAGFATKFNPKISPSTSAPGECLLELTGPSNTIAVDDDYHALVSLAPSTTVGARVTFIVGLKWSQRDICDVGGYQTMPGGRVFTCN